MFKCFSILWHGPQPSDQLSWTDWASPISSLPKSRCSQDGCGCSRWTLTELGRNCRSKLPLKYMPSSKRHPKHRPCSIRSTSHRGGNAWKQCYVRIGNGLGTLFWIGGWVCSEAIQDISPEETQGNSGSCSTERCMDSTNHRGFHAIGEYLLGCPIPGVGRQTTLTRCGRLITQCTSEAGPMPGSDLI